MCIPIHTLHDVTILLSNDNRSTFSSLLTSALSPRNMPRQLRENSLTDEIIIPPTLPIHIVLARNLITLVHPLPTAQSTRGNFVIAVTGSVDCRLTLSSLSRRLGGAVTPPTAKIETGKGTWIR